MSIDQARHPAGAPTGGQFATTALPEAAVTLRPAVTDAEADADTAVTASWVEGEKLADRMNAAREHLSLVRSKQFHAESRGRHDDAREWEQRVVAAEEDLGDLEALHAGTVPGMAALQARYDFHQRAAEEDETDTRWLARASRHREQADLAARQLRDVDDVVLMPVTGGHDLPEATYRAWEPVTMVAAPVQHPWQPTPSQYRVSFVDTTRARPVELARVTLPATLCEQGGRVDKGAVIDAVTHATASTDPERAAAAGVVLTWVGRPHSRTA